MNGLEYLMNPNLDRSQDEEMGKMDKSGRMPISMVSDKYTGFQTCNISIPNGANYSSQVFQFDLSNDYDAVVGIGCIGIDGGTTSFTTSTLLNFNVQIEDESGIIFSRVNIKAWMQNLLYLNKNIEDYFRPTYIPARGRKIKFIIDILNSSGAEVNFAFVLLMKKRVLPSPYKFDFSSTRITIPSYSGASFSAPVIQKFDLNIIPASFSEIVGLLIVATGQTGLSKEDLYLADAELYYKNEIVTDYIPITFFKSYSYFAPSDKLFFNMGINKLFYPVYKNNANSLILSLFLKHFTDNNNSKILDVIFLIRKK